MGYYSGFGVPFFGLFKIPGASKENVDKEMSKKAYDIHKGFISFYIISFYNV